MIPLLYPLSLKFGARYITGQWVFSLLPTFLAFYFILFFIFCYVFHHRICVFIIFIFFSRLSIRFPRLDFNQSERGIGGSKLSVELHVDSLTFSVCEHSVNILV